MNRSYEVKRGISTRYVNRLFQRRLFRNSCNDLPTTASLIGRVTLATKLKSPIANDFSFTMFAGEKKSNGIERDFVEKSNVKTHQDCLVHWRAVHVDEGADEHQRIHGEMPRARRNQIQTSPRRNMENRAAVRPRRPKHRDSGSGGSPSFFWSRRRTGSCPSTSVVLTYALCSSYFETRPANIHTNRCFSFNLLALWEGIALLIRLLVVRR